MDENEHPSDPAAQTPEGDPTASAPDSGSDSDPAEHGAPEAPANAEAPSDPSGAVSQDDPTAAEHVTASPGTISEVVPPQSMPAGTGSQGDQGTPGAVKREAGIRAGYPKVRYHPVHGAKAFATPDEFAAVEDDLDWRFKTAGEADAARTYEEAELVRLNTQRIKMENHAKAGNSIVRNSAQAEEALQSGKNEPL